MGHSCFHFLNFCFRVQLKIILTFCGTSLNAYIKENELYKYLDLGERNFARNWLGLMTIICRRCAPRNSVDGMFYPPIPPPPPFSTPSHIPAGWFPSRQRARCNIYCTHRMASRGNQPCALVLRLCKNKPHSALKALEMSRQLARSKSRDRKTPKIAVQGCNNDPPISSLARIREHEGGLAWGEGARNMFPIIIKSSCRGSEF